MESSASRRPSRRQRPKRRPERQQIMLRRGLALGGALVVLVLIVLGVKGCLDARAHRALTDYARNVEQIASSTEQTSKNFFEKLEDPGTLSVTEFTNQIDADRSAIDSLATRVEGLSAPGELSHAQSTLELVYELRANAMDEIAAKMGTALGNEGAAKAAGAIARQMQKLLASDVLYEQIVRPEIDSDLQNNGVEGGGVPKSTFLPSNEWLEESKVSAALAAVSGSTGAATPGVHGLELTGVSVNGTELTTEGANAVAIEESAEVEVSVENQGESTENGVHVAVSVAGGKTLEGTIDQVAAGEIGSTTIPLTPTPEGEATLEVKAGPVPGEHITENN
ncbi:MAG TPA: CARDB domain-containing protein [Acidimicrobiales bacterium]|nr:CARDB domain-containing protein [Acidimicrobiales bacterium]